MKNTARLSNPPRCILAIALCLVAGNLWAQGATRPQTDSDAHARTESPMQLGDKTSGLDVFRFETFGNEGFWTDALRLPQGMQAAGVTVVEALKLGLNFDAERMQPALRESLARELNGDRSATSAPLLNDPSTMQRLVRMNAVIGVVPKPGKVGVTCALCHTITDGSVFSVPGQGSIGRRIDGPTPHSLSVGKLLALGANTRAAFPFLQLEIDGKTIGRAPKGVTATSTEAEIDAYLNDPANYPPGSFDDTPDGNGNPVHIQPLFRQDLAAPFGSSGQNSVLDHFSNAAYTNILDPTTLVTPSGRAFLKTLGGMAGEKIANDYARILGETHVSSPPYVHATKAGKPGAEATPVGLRVDNPKLLDLNAYLASLPAPKGAAVDAKLAGSGRELFRGQCTSCHDVDQSKPVPDALVAMERIFPGYQPTVIAQRKPPLSPIQNSPGTFDDKMVVVDASPRGDIRGNALPLLLDLARKPVFLNDDSVPSLDALLDPKRGARAPHPFYVVDPAKRKEMVEFLRSLDTGK